MQGRYGKERYNSSMINRVLMISLLLLLSSRRL